MKYLYFLKIIFMCRFLISCGDHDIKNTKKKYLNEIKANGVSQNLKRHLANKIGWFLPVFQSYNKQQAVFYFDKNDNTLAMGSLNDTVSAVKKVKLYDFVPLMDGELYSLSINNDTFNLFFSEKKLVFRFCLNDSFQLKYFKSYDLSRRINSEKYFLRFNFLQGLKIIDSYTYIPFGSTSSRDEFMGKNAYFRISLTDTTILPERVLPTCEEYIGNYRRNKDTYIFKLSSTTGLYMYRTVDRVNSFNLATGEIEKETNFNPYSNYIQFDYSQRKDLGYIRWYEEVNESNENILLVNHQIIIIKRVKRDKIYEPIIYEYLILDSKRNYSVSHYGQFKNDVVPRFSYPYKDGFIIFDKSLIKAYYYDIK